MKGTFCFLNGKTKTKSPSSNAPSPAWKLPAALPHTQAQVAALGAASARCAK